MRTKWMVLGVSMLLVGASLMFAGTVSGKVTYTGTPAHQKPIDMSKEPSCAKQHPTPITTETVVTDPNNALDNVVVYVSSGAPDDGQVPSQTITYTQKGCQYIPHVLPMRVDQTFEIVNDDQTSHKHSPATKDQHRVEQVAAAWNSADQRKIRQAGVHTGKVQHSPLDARLVRRMEDLALRPEQRWRRFQVAEPASGKVHHHCLA